MILNEFEQKMAMDYVTYMMMGSYFPKTIFPAKALEKQMSYFYTLLGSNCQIRLEQQTENFFQNKVRPVVETKLGKDFLNYPVKVLWFRSNDGKHSAIVFANAVGQVWVSSRYGGRIKTPIFRFCCTDLLSKQKASGKIPVQRYLDSLWAEPKKKNKYRKKRSGYAA